ncbi:TniB family NTP-binding protein [Klebsiella oxytoca]|uniref:TniB family NTP-binding protein n=1 Tax=Klebsiella oxytoca TaxID=571 RepID=UPI00357143A7
MIRLTSTNEAKLSLFVNCYVETPVLRTIEQDFDRLRYNRLLGGEPQCMLLTGDTGSGKSFLVRHYMSQSPVQNIHGYIRKPLLISRIPSRPTLESTIAELLKDLGQWGTDYRRNKSSAENLTESLIKCLNRCETELIIIDEFQELIENKTREKSNQIANRLKYISETAKIPIVLVGMPWAAKIAEEPQWASRLLIRRNIPYFRLSKNPQEFIRLVMGFAKKMPFSDPPKLENQLTTYALFSACQGSIRLLKNLLDESVKQALLIDQTILTHENIGTAFSIFFPDTENPFLLPLEEIKGCEIKQYSRYAIDPSGKEERLFPQQFTDRIPISQLLRK